LYAGFISIDFAAEPMAGAAISREKAIRPAGLVEAIAAAIAAAAPKPRHRDWISWAQ
jgi:hypothetical protein